MFRQKRTIWQRLTGSEPATAIIEEDDRRAHARYPTDRSMRVRPESAGMEGVTARVQNVSRGGIRFVVDHCLDRGCTLRVDLPPVPGQPATTVLACVVHVQPLPNDEWSVGCSFATELNDADLRSFGVQVPVPAEKRAHERLPARGQVIYSAVDSEAPGKSAPIHNISLNGLALILRERVEPGKLLNLEMHNANDEAVLTIVGCVVYLAEAEPGSWIAGCNFIRELDDTELAGVLK